MALQLGIANVDAMLSIMPSQQFTNWMAYQSLYGPVSNHIRGDKQAALISSIVAQANAKKGKRFRMKDFILHPINPKKEQTTKDHLRLAETLVMMTGGQDLRGQNA